MSTAADGNAKKEVIDMRFPQPVSIHGGHSGQFCSHARDTLEAIIAAYARKGYLWVGITEHMPPASDAFVYPEERQAGLNALSLLDRFHQYMVTCRDLQRRYAGRMRVFVGFETEYTTGSLELARTLIRRFTPDYVVGSVHHVRDIPFDTDRSSYLGAADRCGGVDELYATYFDHQYEMIHQLHPQVVGHLDIIRMYDPDYRSRFLRPPIWQRVVLNLETIKALNLILDFNLRPLSRGEDEPYLTGPILEKAVELGIPIVPGDDSHGLDDIDRNMPAALARLRTVGGLPSTWRIPVRDH
jgi:histidinol-phosphatase (PHP family)